MGQGRSTHLLPDVQFKQQDNGHNRSQANALLVRCLPQTLQCQDQYHNASLQNPHAKMGHCNVSLVNFPQGSFQYETAQGFDNFPKIRLVLGTPLEGGMEARQFQNGKSG